MIAPASITRRTRSIMTRSRKFRFFRTMAKAGLCSPALAIVLKNLNLRLRVIMDLVRRVIEAGAIIALALWLQNVWALLLGQLIGMSVGSLLSFWVAPFRPRLSLYRP